VSDGGYKAQRRVRFRLVGPPRHPGPSTAFIRLYDSSLQGHRKGPPPRGKTPLVGPVQARRSKCRQLLPPPHMDVLFGEHPPAGASQTLPGEMVLHTAWSTDGRHLYASNGGMKGPFVLARFGEGGMGRMEEIKAERGSNRSTRSTKTAFLPLRNGSLVFANMDPPWVIVTGTVKPFSTWSRLRCGSWGDDTSWLRLTAQHRGPVQCPRHREGGRCLFSFATCAFERNCGTPR
jgi:hypothetical protein